MGFIGKQPTPVPLVSSDITDGIISTAKIADDAVGNTKLDLSANYAFTGTITGTKGILQTKTFVTESVATTTSNTFTDTGLFSAQFDTALQSSSKVLATVHCIIGQPYDGSWARLNYITIFDGSTNKSDSPSNPDTYGIGGNAPLGASWAGTGYIQHDSAHISGSVLFTPSSTNPTIKLAYKSHDSVNLSIGRHWAGGETLAVSPTRLTIQEISA